MNEQSDQNQLHEVRKQYQRRWLLPILIGVNSLIVIVVVLIFWLSTQSDATIIAPSVSAAEVEFPYETVILGSEGLSRTVISSQLLVKLTAPDDDRDAELWKTVGATGGFSLGKGYWLYYFDSGVDMTLKLGELRMLSQVENAEYDDVFDLSFVPSDYAVTVGTAGEAYWWEMIQAPDMWDIIRVASVRKGVVGLIDSQVSTDHYELSGMTSNLDEGEGELHGTSVAGLISAKSDNNVGITSIGLNDLTVRSARACYGNLCAASLVVWALNSLSDLGIRVVNMSFATASDNQIVHGVITNAWEQGVVLVAASGNGGSTTPLYPAAYSEVISATAIDQNREVLDFATYGEWVDFSVPGSSVVTTGLSDSTVELSGTSASSAILSGLASLCLSLNPALTNGEIRSLLQKGASADEFSRYGLVNAFEIMQACKSTVLGAQDEKNGEVLQAAEGAGAFTACVVPDWYCSGTDVLVPPIRCDAVQILKENSSVTRCKKCSDDQENYVFPRPVGWQCPTGQDGGQKDGTGAIGADRLYNYFDYEQGTVMSVPPIGFGVGGPTTQ